MGVLARKGEVWLVSWLADLDLDIIVVARTKKMATMPNKEGRRQKEAKRENGHTNRPKICFSCGFGSRFVDWRCWHGDENRSSHRLPTRPLSTGVESQKDGIVKELLELYYQFCILAIREIK